jgi:hypothetical protein
MTKTGFIVSVHPEIGKFGRDQGARKNLTAGIWLIFRGLNFSRNADIGQIGHFWMGTSYGPGRKATITKVR